MVASKSPESDFITAIHGEAWYWEKPNVTSYGNTELSKISWESFRINQPEDITLFVPPPTHVNYTVWKSQSFSYNFIFLKKFYF